MDYFSLVNMLSLRITPEIRKLVLGRMTEMNNELLGVRNQSPITSSPPSRQKDATELVHPSFVRQPYHAYGSTHRSPQTLDSKQSTCHIELSPNSPEIDLDDILGEPESQPDELDLRLARIKKLHNKILANKRQRTESKNKRRLERSE